MSEKIEKVLIKWAMYSINENFPEKLLEKNYTDQNYIPVDIVRSIMRQIGGFSSPKFSDLEVLWKSVYNSKDVILYRQKVEISYWDKILYWEWVHAVTSGKMFTDSSTWVFSTLRSKCLRDALKYEFAIFEYPEVEDSSWIWDDEITKVSEDKSKVNKSKEDVVAWEKKEDSERLSKIRSYDDTLLQTINTLNQDPTVVDDAKTLFESIKWELSEMKLEAKEKKILIKNRNDLDQLIKSIESNNNL